jgi:carboxyl-terminal processing protease
MNLGICCSWKSGSFICLLIMIIAMTLANSGCAAGHGLFARTPVEPGDLFDQVVTIVDKNYIDKSGNKVNLDTSMRPDVSTIIAQLDSTSVLYSPEDLSITENSSRGAIGLWGDLKDSALEIRGTYPISPARKAGLQRGDKITAINDTPVSDPSPLKMIRLLQGEPGSEVTLKIVTRSGNEKTVRLVREVLKMPQTAAEYFVEGKVGYLRIERFDSDTPKEVEEAIKRLIKNHMTGLIIDVRNNSGGLLTSVAEVSELFLDRGQVIATLNGRYDGQKKVFTAAVWSSYKDFPVVVLIDGQTSSGAEILAASLRDNKRARLIGDNTRGLCVIQAVYPLKDNSKLRIRTTLAYTPNDEPIDGRGVKPDIPISLIKEEYERLYDRMAEFPELKSVDIKTDNQLKTAVSTLIEKCAK